MNKDTNVMERLNRSEVYGDYQKAFGEATELPLTLRPLESWQLAHRHQAHENPFCATMAQANRTCAACLEVQQRAVEGAKDGPATITCFAGLLRHGCTHQAWRENHRVSGGGPGRGRRG